MLINNDIINTDIKIDLFCLPTPAAMKTYNNKNDNARIRELVSYKKYKIITVPANFGEHNYYAVLLLKQKLLIDGIRKSPLLPPSPHYIPSPNTGSLYLYTIYMYLYIICI